MLFKFGPECSDFYVYGKYSILLAIGLGVVFSLLAGFLTPISFNPFITMNSGGGGVGGRVPGSEIAGSSGRVPGSEIAASGTTPWDPTGKNLCQTGTVWDNWDQRCIPITSSAPSGQEQTFVAELYKNGQLVSSESIGK
jgi:hypothetical protein